MRNPLKNISITKSIRWIIKKISKFKKTTIGCLIFGFIFTAGVFVNLNSLFDKSNKDVAREGEENTAQILTSVESNSDELKSKIDDISVKIFDCSSLKKSWNSSNKSSIEENFLILKKGERFGSATFNNQFNNLFIIDILFNPSSSDFVNTNISTNDIRGNEIKISVGDNNLDRVKIFSNKDIEGVTTSLPAKIDSTKEIRLRIQIILRADSTRTSGFISYYPKNKSEQPIIENIEDYDLPINFLSSDVSLNIGITGFEEDIYSRKIELLKCEIREK